MENDILYSKFKRRIIICGWFRYPRGDATANYTQYLAKALSESGYQVNILSRINTSGMKKITDDVVLYDICSQNRNYYVRRFENGKMFPLFFVRKLRKFKLNKDDVVIVHNGFRAINALMKYKKKRGFKTVGLLLEWFGREQYADEKAANAGEKEFRRCEEHDLIFPISHNIQKQFPIVPSIVLPIMGDISEFDIKPKSNGKYVFIFPANGFMKDALKEMLQGLSLLTLDELQKIEFHLTGVKQEKLMELLTEEEYLLLKNCLILHSWMEYDDLIALYQNAHYLLLAREINQMTLSNFPSKVPEVMTHGVVPVVSRVGDYTKYYLEDGVNSIIFDGCSAEQCVLAIRRAIQVPFDKYCLLSSGARNCVKEKFDFHNWSAKISKAIEEMFVRNEKNGNI